MKCRLVAVVVTQCASLHDAFYKYDVCPFLGEPEWQAHVEKFKARASLDWRRRASLVAL